jgi:hypothetical protein
MLRAVLYHRQANRRRKTGRIKSIVNDRFPWGGDSKWLPQ